MPLNLYLFNPNTLDEPNLPHKLLMLIALTCYRSSIIATWTDLVAVALMLPATAQPGSVQMCGIAFT
jgi:hypothetical protein